jgi:O-antigen ligase
MAATGLATTRPRVTVQRRSMAGVLRDFGPFALGVYLLATARWGSYLLPGPPYISDLFIILLVAERAMAATRSLPALSRVETSVALACGGLLVWTALRFAYGSFTANAIRDAAPYGYAILVFLTPSRALSDTDHRKMVRVLLAGLFFHSAWVTLETLSPGFGSGLPPLGGGQSVFFELRPDVDQTVCAVLGLICLNRAITGTSPGVYLGLAAWNAALVLTGHSRAALAAAGVMFVVFALFTPARRELFRRHTPRVIVAVLIVAIAGLAYGLNRGQAAARLGSAGNAYLPIVPTSGPVPEHAIGTARARQQAWQAIERYLEANSSRNWTGVGFGPDFLHDSGGDQLLLGASSQDVRQPHNFLINTWARLGLIGLAIILVILAVGVRLAALVSRNRSLDDVDLAAVLIVTGFPVAACYGVVLESPFGAIPYFWALGYLGWRLLDLRSNVRVRRA